MKNKLFKAVVGTFAMVAALSVMPMATATVEAAECETYSVAFECSHPNLQVTDVIFNDGWRCVSGDQHVRTGEYYYYCPGCQASWVAFKDEYGDHTYEFDYSANEWVCTVCGDSYTN